MSIPPISPPQAEYQWGFCHLLLRYSVDRFDFLTHGLACTACSPAIWRVFRVCRSPSKRLRRFLVSPTPHPPPECFYLSSASLPFSPPISPSPLLHIPPPTNHLHVSMHSAVVQLTSPPPPPSSTSTSFEISPPSALTSFRYFFKLSSATFFTFSSFSPHAPPQNSPSAFHVRGPLAAVLLRYRQYPSWARFRRVSKGRCRGIARNSRTFRSRFHLDSTNTRLAPRPGPPVITMSCF